MPTQFETAGKAVTDNVQYWKNTFSRLLSFFPELFSKIKNVFKEKWEDIKSWVFNFVPNLIDSIRNFFAELPYKIGQAIGHVIVKLAEWAQSISNWGTTELPKVITGIVDFFKSIPSKIGSAISGVIGKLGEWFNSVMSWVKREVPKIPSKIAEFFEMLPDRIKQIGKDMVNGLIDMLNWGVGKVIGFFNKILSGVNSVTSKAGIKVDQIQWNPIEHLAKGGVAYGEVAAVVGDNFNARQDPEVISPLSTLKNMIVEALVQKDISSGGSEINIKMTLDSGEVLADMMIDPMNNTAKNKGYAPVFRPAT